MHILTLIMLHQHRFCVYKGSKITDYLRKLCTFCTFGARLLVYDLLCKYCFWKIWEKSFITVEEFERGSVGFLNTTIIFAHAPKYMGEIRQLLQS